MGGLCYAPNKQQQYFEGQQKHETVYAFTPCQPVKLPQKINDLMNKIKKVCSITDPRSKKFVWHKSINRDFYYYGQLMNGKPFGQCMFFDPTAKQSNRPIIISTKINSHFGFASNTLLIYGDRSYYCGQIFNRSYDLPRASGKGILVSQNFIYEGQFKDGYPNGYGYFQTKSLQFAGIFKKGIPAGQGIERSHQGLFIGQLFSHYKKKGYQITPQNKKIFIDQHVQSNQFSTQSRFSNTK